jgi:hypothetical protein
VIEGHIHEAVEGMAVQSPLNMSEWGDGGLDTRPRG